MKLNESCLVAEDDLPNLLRMASKCRLVKFNYLIKTLDGC